MWSTQQRRIIIAHIPWGGGTVPRSAATTTRMTAAHLSSSFSDRRRPRPWTLTSATMMVRRITSSTHDPTVVVRTESPGPSNDDDAAADEENDSVANDNEERGPEHSTTPRPALGSIYHPMTQSSTLSSLVQESLRSALVGTDNRTKDTGMSVIFLGTSAGLPSKTRSPSSTLIRLGGQSIVVDVGEGTQRQLMFTSTNHTLAKIHTILITHLHGDHIFGLPGLLLGLQRANQQMSQQEQQSQQKQQQQPLVDEGGEENGSGNPTLRSTPKQQHQQQLQQQEGRRLVKIYGPPGLYNYIASNIILSCTLFHSVQIEVIELVGGRVRRTHGNPREVRNPFEANYPEFNFGSMTRTQLPCGPDGIWTLEDLPSHVTREDVLSKSSSFNNNHNSKKKKKKKNVSRGTTTGENPRYQIQAAEVDHLSGVVTFGYSIQEEEPPRNIDAAKAQELGVSPMGRKYNLLKAGFSVYTDDGSRQVQPSEVLIESRKKARKITVVGDNRGWTAAMKRVAQHSDVLVHEATLMEKDSDWRVRSKSRRVCCCCCCCCVTDHCRYLMDTNSTPPVLSETRTLDRRDGGEDEWGGQCETLGTQSH